MDKDSFIIKTLKKLSKTQSLNIKKKSKFDIDQVKIIKNIGSKKSIKVAKIELLEKHNLKVSDTIIRKILSDKY